MRASSPSSPSPRFIGCFIASSTQHCSSSGPASVPHFASERQRLGDWVCQYNACRVLQVVCVHSLIASRTMMRPGRAGAHELQNTCTPSRTVWIIVGTTFTGLEAPLSKIPHQSTLLLWQRAYMSLLWCMAYCRCITLCKSQRSGQIATFPTPFVLKKITLYTVGYVDVGSEKKRGDQLGSAKGKKNVGVVYKGFPHTQIPAIFLTKLTSAHQCD
ncbi:hypothetical protein BJY52DRAFT_1255900 [Lactarius psammicola]|nr:hypothetical protein BJY52DRAFT_1255900 [Lactarius psammicola]